MILTCMRGSDWAGIHSKLAMAVAVSFKGVVFVAALATTALIGAITILAPGLLLLPISMTAYRRYTEFIFELWLIFVTVSLE